MNKVVHYLDCGCAIMEDGRRVWCPTCLAAPAPTPTELHERVEEAIRRARIDSASPSKMWAEYICALIGEAGGLREAVTRTLTYLREVNTNTNDVVSDRNAERAEEILVNALRASPAPAGLREAFKDGFDAAPGLPVVPNAEQIAAYAKLRDRLADLRYPRQSAEPEAK